MNPTVKNFAAGARQQVAPEKRPLSTRHVQPKKAAPTKR
jgi:hypothetical protein